MTTKKNTNALEGKNIYHDKHGKAIYYVKKEKRGYRITPEKANTYRTLEPRLLYAILMFIFTYFLFKFNIWICLVLAIGSYIFMEWKFRKFLNNCTIIENYNPSIEDNTRASTLMPMKQLVMRAALFIILGVLLIVNAFVSKSVASDQTIQIISVIVGLIVIFAGLKYVGLIIKKKNLEKEEASK